MKNALYSTRLENIYNDISSANNMNLSKYNNFKKNIASISSLLKNEQNYLNKFATNVNFRKNMKKKLRTNINNQLTDVVLGFISEKKISQMNDKIKNGNQEKQEFCINATLNNFNLGFLNKSQKAKNQTIVNNKTDEKYEKSESERCKKTLLDVQESGKEAFKKIVNIIDNFNTKILDKDKKKSRNKKDLINVDKTKSSKFKSCDNPKNDKIKLKNLIESPNSSKLNIQPVVISQSIKTSSTFFRSTKDNTAVPNLELTKESFNSYFNTEENLSCKLFHKLAKSNRNSRNKLFSKLKEEAMSGSISKENKNYLFSTFAPRKSVQALQPKFKATEGLNNFVIRNFLIKDQNDPLGASKNQFKISQNFFLEKEEKTKTKKLKEMAKYQEITGNQVFLDQIFVKKDNSLDEDNDETTIGSDTFRREHNRKTKLKIIENSKNLVDWIQKISTVEYQIMDESEINTGRINLHNLNKVVRLRNVIKNKMDPDSVDTDIKEPAKFKEMVEKNHDEVVKIMKKLGPPSFLKSKFKTATLNKFKVVNGKYFGC
jgi:hypothetical protein